MLKYYIYLTLLLFAGCQVKAHKAEEDLDIVQNYVKNKCLKNGGENAFNELLVDVEKAYLCVRNSFDKIKPRNESHLLHIVCTELHPVFRSCIHILLDAIDPCLDLEEKYLPNFMSEWFNQSYTDECEGGEQKFKEYFQFYESLRHIECKSEDQERLSSINEKCYLKSTILKDFESPDFIITKATLCGYLEHVYQCVRDTVNGTCIEAVNAYAEDSFRPVKILCGKQVNNVEDN